MAVPINVSADRAGRMSENSPSFVNNVRAREASPSSERLCVWRAMFRAAWGQNTSSSKYGGLVTMWSKRSPLLTSIVRRSCRHTRMRCAHGEACTLAVACSTAPASMSMPVTNARGARCATIKAMSPLPVPTSSTRRARDTSAHAPISTPSVPTFMAQRSWYTVNCLNEKYGFGITVAKIQRIVTKTYRCFGLWGVLSIFAYLIM